MSVFNYKVNGFWCDMFGCYNQIVFVFVIFVIYQDNYFILLNIFKDFSCSIQCYNCFFVQGYFFKQLFLVKNVRLILDCF